ncbi:MAG: hypothetical protein FWC32_06000 [Firmicutes bacterium]|nr:hypothetical protein [Bacillota bacterium]
MKSKKMLILGILALLTLLLISACGGNSNNGNGRERQHESTSESNNQTVGANAGVSGSADSEFFFSDGLDENGFWQGIAVLDYVELFNYQAFPIPAEVYQVSDTAIQNVIDDILSQAAQQRITDRPVADGDLINIDFVGSVDGVEFDGGNTFGAGTYVTAGSPEFIDDFLHQVIGHMPGSVVNVEVAFPDDYFEASLAGAEALFVTTINYIAGRPELTDEFVFENFAHLEGIETVDDLINDIHNFFQSNAIIDYLYNYMMTQVVVRSIPDSVMRYHEQAMLQQAADQAMQFGMDLETFLSMQDFDTVEDFFEDNRENIQMNARLSLVLQAVAEDAGITATIDDVAQFFIENMGTDDFSMFEEMYGLPWLKQFIRNDKVIDYIRERVVVV